MSKRAKKAMEKQKAKGEEVDEEDFVEQINAVKRMKIDQ